MSTLSTGLCFCGMAEETPRPGTDGSASSANSGLDSSSTFSAIVPSASDSPARLSPNLVMGARWFCHGTAGIARPRESAMRWASSSPVPLAPNTANDASVPPAPPHCTGSSARDSARAEPTRPCSQPAAFTPNVRRHAVLGERARDHERCAVPIGQRRERVDRHGSIAEDADPGAAGDEHQRRVEDVLTGGAAVHPEPGVRVDRGDGVPQVADERDHRVPAAPGTRWRGSTGSKLESAIADLTASGAARGASPSSA